MPACFDFTLEVIVTTKDWVDTLLDRQGRTIGVIPFDYSCERSIILVNFMS